MLPARSLSTLEGRCFGSVSALLRPSGSVYATHMHACDFCLVWGANAEKEEGGQAETAGIPDRQILFVYCFGGRSATAGKITT